MVKDSEYAYAVAKIKALSTRLLDKNDLSRMVDANDMEDIFKMLIDRGYKMSDALDDILDEELSKIFDFCQKLMRQEHVKMIEALRRKYDYHNVKVLIKAELLGEDKNYLLSDSGSIPSENLSVAIHDRKFSKLPGKMQNAVMNCFDILNQERNTQKCDIVLDRACFGDMLELAEESKNSYFIKLVKYQIDVANVTTFMRIKKNGGSDHTIKEVLVAGGNIDPKKLTINMGYDKIKGYLKNSGYGKDIETAIDQLENEGSFILIERSLDDFLIRYVKSVRFQSFGPEPILSYLFAKENELKAVRIVASGKLSGVADDIIRERLRETYV